MQAAPPGQTVQAALQPAPVPYPGCHFFINHKYQYIFVTHPKR